MIGPISRDSDRTGSAPDPALAYRRSAEPRAFGRLVRDRGTARVGRSRSTGSACRIGDAESMPRRSQRGGRRPGDSALPWAPSSRPVGASAPRD